MTTYDDHLRLAKGSHIKARRNYMRERRWTDDDWQSAWRNGLGDEVEAAAKRA